MHRQITVLFGPEKEVYERNVPVERNKAIYQLFRCYPFLKSIFSKEKAYAAKVCRSIAASFIRK
jgi:hypothetical protein